MKMKNNLVKNLFLILIVILYSNFSVQAENSVPKKINCDEEEMNAKSIDCYNIKLSKILESNWIYYDGNKEHNKNLETTVLIKILKDGRVAHLMFESRSGNSILDDSAINAIIRSIPFPELPKGMYDYQLGLIFTPKGLK